MEGTAPPASRNDGPVDTSIGLIPLDEETQRILIYDLLDYGADKTICVADKYIPYDLVKVDRKMVRALLKTPERLVNESQSYVHQTQTTNDTQRHSSGMFLEIYS